MHTYMFVCVITMVLESSYEFTSGLSSIFLAQSAYCPYIQSDVLCPVDGSVFLIVTL